MVNLYKTGQHMHINILALLDSRVACYCAGGCYAAAFMKYDHDLVWVMNLQLPGYTDSSALRVRLNNANVLSCGSTAPKHTHTHSKSTFHFDPCFQTLRLGSGSRGRSLWPCSLSSHPPPCPCLLPSDGISSLSAVVVTAKG